MRWLFFRKSFLFVAAISSLLFLLKMCGAENQPRNKVLDFDKQLNTVYDKSYNNKDIEADSPKDTLMTLTAHLRNTQATFRKLQSNNEESLRQQNLMRDKLITIQTAQKQFSASIQNIKREVQALSERITENSKPEVDDKQDFEIKNDIKVLDQVKPQYVEYSDISKRQSLRVDSGSQQDDRLLFATANVNNNDKSNQDLSLSDEKLTKLFYTIPENTTLVNTTLFTALLGRVPVNGVVDDPFPFSVLVGSQNLSAMGIKIPGIRGMIMRGTAKGDLTLSCVTGDIISATFIFSDGAIKTIHGSSGSALAVLEDKHGVPCVPGKLISNAKKHITTRSLFGGLHGAARSAANSETTNTLSTNNGVYTSAVTGNSKNFILNNMGAKAIDESVSWWKYRNKQTFDVIFVKPGTKISLLVQKELRIDLDTRSRKVSHSFYKYQSGKSQLSGLD